MRLIADSGSTKTSWRLITSDNKISQFNSPGLNPYLLDESQLVAIMEAVPIPREEVVEIYFYGAGCGLGKNQEKVSKALEKAIGKKTIKVDTDMVGAARGLCGNNPGFVGILGTGANACIYDGSQIIDNIPSLGYLIGDEGSGNWLGRKLIHDFFGEIMDSYAKEIMKKTGVDLEEVYHSVYLSEKPAAYLAKFSQLILANIQHPYFYKLVYEGFKLFFEQNVLYFKDLGKVSLYFTGSVAYYYANILRKVAMEYGFAINNIVPEPIAALALYHKY